VCVCVCVCVCEIVLGGNEGHIWDRELALVNQSERGNILSWAPAGALTHTLTHTETFAVPTIFKEYT